jgi:hypothetical protein
MTANPPSEKELPMTLVRAAFTMVLGLLLSLPARADTTSLQPDFADTRELMVHAFRAPSIGLEYRAGHFGVHAGAYTSALNTAGQATWFFKAGVTGYFLPMRLTSERHSSFYASASFLRGVQTGWSNGFMPEAGFRWAAWKGIDLRLGVAVLLAPGRQVYVNPTPGISWSF